MSGGDREGAVSRWSCPVSRSSGPSLTSGSCAALAASCGCLACGPRGLLRGGPHASPQPHPARCIAGADARRACSRAASGGGEGQPVLVGVRGRRSVLLRAQDLVDTVEVGRGVATPVVPRLLGKQAEQMKPV